jgi:predicted TIM-barrel fold metal-dependent hydrolase
MGSSAERIPFVDAHVHLWELGNRRYPWLMPPFGEGPTDELEIIAVKFGLDNYLSTAKHCDVRGIIHIDADAHPDDAQPETHWLQAMANQCGMPIGVVASATLNNPKIEAILARHAAHKCVRGVRHVAALHPDPNKTYSPRDVTSDAGWQAGFALLKKYNLSFDCQVYLGELSAMTKLIGEHPETPVILNQLGMAMLAGTDVEVLRLEDLQKLAELPNTYMKLSGLRHIRRPWNVDNIRAYILTTIEAFGTRRCLFASDFPIDELFDSFDSHLDAYQAIVSDFSNEEQRDMFGRNANRVYRLGISL